MTAGAICVRRGEAQPRMAVPRTEGHDISCPYKTKLKKKTLCATSGGGGASHGRGRRQRRPGRTVRLCSPVRVAGFSRPSFILRRHPCPFGPDKPTRRVVACKL